MCGDGEERGRGNQSEGYDRIKRRDRGLLFNYLKKGERGRERRKEGDVINYEVVNT